MGQRDHDAVLSGQPDGRRYSELRSAGKCQRSGHCARRPQRTELHPDRSVDAQLREQAGLLGSTFTAARPLTGP